jgi:hypothetical protein
VQAAVGQLARGLGADAPQRLGRPVTHHLVPAVDGQPEHAGRLAELGGDLGPEQVVPDPDRAGQLGLGEHRALDRTGQRLRVVGDGAEEGLVPAHHLDRGARHLGVDERAQHVHHPLRGRLVGRVVRGQEDRVRAPLGRGAQRHARAHPELAGLVGRGGHDGAQGGVALAADHDRPPGQLRAAQDLDRGQELVEVDVQDPVGRRHRVIVGHPSGRSSTPDGRSATRAGRAVLDT